MDFFDNIAGPQSKQPEILAGFGPFFKRNDAGEADNACQFERSGPPLLDALADYCHLLHSPLSSSLEVCLKLAVG
jgi:hypothetical protein